MRLSFLHEDAHPRPDLDIQPGDWVLIRENPELFDVFLHFSDRKCRQCKGNGKCIPITNMGPEYAIDWCPACLGSGYWAEQRLLLQSIMGYEDVVNPNNRDVPDPDTIKRMDWSA